jgi:hypothetical protein
VRKLVPIVAALDPSERLGNMRVCALKGLPLIKRAKKFKDAVLSLACFGPSLKRTWTHAGHPLMTVSGAHDFMISGGIFPDYHVECDPREHKTLFTKNAVEGVEYLMASWCHPSVWDNLKDRNVTVWHPAGEQPIFDYVLGLKEEDAMVGGGSTVGLRALEVACAMGYRRFAIHGMDCSYEGSERHAGFHPNETERVIQIKVNGREFLTSPQMYEAAREFVEIILKFKADIEVMLYGDGLLQELMRTAKTLRRAA